ncbi:cadmium binding protein [Lacticaseibacillus pantheris DSM 15945 = JCM 12539 = NBRC 106106]|jgi:cadmium resistance transport/sequestration family protein|uniref:Cadmium binding protein n=2 Tax=Lacticaseibacillus pantheris TaxID=171523 RepID=A0A0R1TT57_9LACO|nr:MULTISPECIES: cadmium resistance transporter [Lacticaseibacillus]KRL84480.1 cadmium binding protein [Lacticaseibacillus pantheris DSM 15945 = JCM 12539 = NBRC 106106]
MLKTIITGVTAYISTSLDYLLILMMIFGSVKPHQRRLVYWGDLLGTGILVATSLFIALVLRLVPAEWVLGLLGLIPVLMGIKLVLAGEHDDDSVVASRFKPANIISSVALITVATCGADNIGVYVPLFASQTIYATGITLVTFFVMLTLVCWLGAQLGRLPFVARILESTGRWLTAAVYVGIGVYILLENGTITHIFGLA